MLDEHDGDAEVPDAPDQRDQLEGLGGVHAGGRLVQQEERRTRGEGARDLEAALVPVGQVHRELVLVLADPEEVEQRPRAVPALPLLAAGPAGVQHGVEHAGGRAAVRADQDVVQDRHPAEEPDVLVGPGHAERGHLVRRQALQLPPREADHPRRHRIDARDQVEQGGLPRAVRADDGDQLAARHRERHVVHGPEPAEALADAVDRQEALARRPRRLDDRARQELHARSRPLRRRLRAGARGGSAPPTAAPAPATGPPGERASSGSARGRRSSAGTARTPGGPRAPRRG